MNPYLTLSLAIFAEVAATALLKTTNGFSRFLPSGLVILGYLASVVFLAKALRSLPVGIAYAIAAGAGTALLALIAVVVFKQKMDLAAVSGIVLIVAGVAILHLFSEVSA